MDFPSETITKIEAAQRQLRQAILLFFERGDIVAVHTLTCAALQVFSDIGKTKGLDSIIKNPPYVREDKKKEWFAQIHRAQNFFKHADKDPEETLEFHAAATPFFICGAIELQQQLFEGVDSATITFISWFRLAYPDLLIEGPEKDAYLKIHNKHGIDPDNFSCFLELYELSEVQRKAT
jgi:hypothetical protein